MCVNSQGSYSCQCESGYTTNSETDDCEGTEKVLYCVIFFSFLLYEFALDVLFGSLTYVFRGAATEGFWNTRKCMYRSFHLIPSSEDSINRFRIHPSSWI